MSDTNAPIELGEPRAAAAADDVEQEQQQNEGLITGRLRRQNKRLKYALIGVLALAVVAGAATGTYYALRPSSGLTIDRSTEQDFDGTYVHDGQVIRLSLHNTPADQPNVITWSYFFGADGTSRRIDYALDQASTPQTLVLDGHGVVLSDDEKAALFHLKDELATELARAHANQVILNVAMLERTSSYLTQAPAGYSFGRQEFVIGAPSTEQPADGAAAGEPGQIDDAEKRVAGTNAWEEDEGATCLVWGGVYQARFDEGTGGQGWGWWHVAGTNNVCTGRCGATCSWWDESAYKDCFDHDLCVTWLGGSTGPFSADCADEFAHAADDYVVSFWGC